MLKIVFTSEDNENSMFGIEEFPISAEHASQLIRGDMCIERFLNDNLNAPDDISRFKGLLLGINNQTMNQRQSNQLPFLVCRTSAI